MAILKAKHPDQWTKQEVGVWLKWCSEEFSIEPVSPDRIDMNGKALCMLQRGDFMERIPKNGDLLFNALQKLIHNKVCHNSPMTSMCSVGGPMSLPLGPFPIKTERVSPLMPMLTPTNTNTTSMHAPSIPRPILPRPVASILPPTGTSSVIHNSKPYCTAVSTLPGILSPAPSNVDTESASSDNGSVSDPEGAQDNEQKQPMETNNDRLLPTTIKTEIHSIQSAFQTVNTIKPEAGSECRLLWEFIHQLLQSPRYSQLVCWENQKDLVFRINNPTGLAHMWGQQKNRTNMTYEKLSRALRYYYRMNIIKKVSGKRLTYNLAMDEYLCYYCNTKYESLELVVDHCCNWHITEELRYRQLVLDESSGKFRYLSKTHSQIIPLQLMHNGKSVSVSGDRLLIKDDSKRKKLNTPSKIVRNDFSDSSTESSSDEEGALKMDEDESTDNSINISSALGELESLLPKVVQTLIESGHLETYIKFNELLAQNQLPMNNICYLLFLDLVEWFSVNNRNTSHMRYKFPETLQFWQIGLRLFHGKFIRFMSGTKNQGQVIDQTSEKGNFDPIRSSINFAVPSQTTLHKSLSTNPSYLPGINEQLIEQLGNYYDGKPMVLGIDGKKISRGKGKVMGDIDCWDFEDKPTLKERLKVLKIDVEFLEEAIQRYDKIDTSTVTFLDNLLETSKDDIVTVLKKIVVMIGKRNEQLRQTEVILCRSEEKFKSLGGESWRTSKYFPVISLMRVKRNQIKIQLEESLKLSDDIAELGSFLNASYGNFNKSSATVSMSTQQNFIELNEKYYSTDANTRYVKQRTDAWFEIRSNAKVTGSTANSALGLDTLKRQKEHFENVIEGKEKPDFDSETKKRMTFGTEHEIDAIATVLSKVIPFYYPTLSYFEEGCQVVPCNNDNFFMVVSPDGSFRTEEHREPSMMFENKCKSPSSFSPHVYYRIPKYYAVQLLSEMHAYNCKELLFTCWSEVSLSAFHVNFDEELWKKCWQELVDIYATEKKVKPTRFRPEVKALHAHIQKYLDTHVSFLGEFMSCNASKSDASNVSDDNPFVFPRPEKKKGKRFKTIDVIDSLIKAKKWIEQVYELTRTVATEILVYMVNDVDRIYNPEVSLAHPIAYAMKGSSMNNATFRKMANEVISHCEKQGLRILATSSDGQWHRYGVRNEKDEPLTVLQLQKDHWKRINSMDKGSIARMIKNTWVVQNTDDVHYEKNNQTGVLVVYEHARDKKVVGKLNGNKRSTSNSRKCAKNSQQDSNDEHEAVSVGLCNDLITSELEADMTTMEEINKVISSANDRTHFTANSELENPLIGLEDCFIEFQRENFQVNTAMTQNVDNPEVNMNETDKDLTGRPSVYPKTIENTTGTLMASAMNVLYMGEVDATFELAGNIFSEENEINLAHTQTEPNLPETVITHMDNSTSNDNLLVDHQHFRVITAQDFERMLKTLQANEEAERKHKWSQVSSVQFQRFFKTKSSCNTHFNKFELQACIKTLKDVYDDAFPDYQSSWTKPRIVSSFLELEFEKQSSEMRKPIRRKQSIKSLKQLCCIYLEQESKENLAKLLSENTWENTYTDWQLKSPIPNGIDVESTDNDIHWFSQPAVNGDNKIRFHFTDASHILTCLRTKLCTSGIEGLNRKAWEIAAESAETSLNITLILDCVDKQDVSLARRVFGEDVEASMPEEFFAERQFCRLIREWFDSEDEPGVSALNRCKSRIELRKWLLEEYDSKTFPPPTRYIRGIPIQTFEALVTHIERKIQIYPICGGRYNSRAISSQQVENFFSTFRDLDSTGKGTPKPDSIPKIMQAVAEIEKMRINPNRSFSMATCKRNVYPYQVCGIEGGSERNTNVRLSQMRVIEPKFMQQPSMIQKGQRGAKPHNKCDLPLFQNRFPYPGLKEEPAVDSYTVTNPVGGLNNNGEQGSSNGSRRDHEIHDKTDQPSSKSSSLTSNVDSENFEQQGYLQERSTISIPDPRIASGRFHFSPSYERKHPNLKPLDVRTNIQNDIDISPDVKLNLDSFGLLSPLSFETYPSNNKRLYPSTPTSYYNRHFKDNPQDEPEDLSFTSKKKRRASEIETEMSSQDAPPSDENKLLPLLINFKKTTNSNDDEV